MPLNFLGSVIAEGTDVIPFWPHIKQYGPYVLTIGAVKRYFSGATNTWERDLHGRVVLITGGTSGVGAVMARELATRGAQVILLVKSLKDEWLATYVDDLKDATGNFMIYAEECHLADLRSVRKFATSWLDNVPPRRLDMIICCAAVAGPPLQGRQACSNGIEQHLQVNYLGHYHLLTLLSPALRAQPPDRDVRVVLTSCITSVMGDLDLTDLEFSNRGYPSSQPWKVIGASKLALTMFAYEYQRRLLAYERPDKAPVNIRLAVVDPGLMRSPSFKRFVSLGTIWGLLIYLVTWPLWWLLLKTSIQGAQSVLYASMSPEVSSSDELSYISDCKIRARPPRKELRDSELQKSLFDLTERLITQAEKSEAVSKGQKEKTDSKASSSKKL